MTIIRNFWVDELRFFVDGQIVPVGELRIQCDDTFSGKVFYCKAFYNNEQVLGTWAITAGSQYATINSNGRVDVVSGTQSQSLTITCSANGLTATKQVTASSANQLTIEGADAMTGTSGNVVARYNEAVVQPTWSITSGGNCATIDQTGAITISQSGTIVVQAVHEGLTTTKTIQLTYAANKSSETIVKPDGSVTTMEETIVQNQDGSTTTQTTATTTNEDGSYSQTETQTTENLDGSSTTTSTTVNQDGSSSETSSSTTAPDPQTGTTTT